MLSHLKSLSADIIFLQETHIRPTEQGRLRSPWISYIYQSSFSSKARGVAILIRKTIPFIFESMSTDPAGRFVLVTGSINSVPLALLNIYAPNFDCPDFFCRVFDLVDSHSSRNIIIGGDFNCYLDPQADRSSSKPAPPLKSIPTVNNLMKSLDLVDIWRLQHPSDRQYSFFSPVHGSFSRIDYFLVDARLISKVDNSTYHSILVSDHAPLAININFDLNICHYNWKFSPALLSDKKFCEYLSNKIADFLQCNDTGEVSDSILWETFKVVVRGQVMSYQSFCKRARLRRLSEIDSELSALEESYRNSKSEDTLNAILKIKYEYNQILGGQVRHYICRLKQTHFELGEKAHKLLARQIKGVQADRAIHKIYSASGQLITDPKSINKRFFDFYSHLYTSRSTASDTEIANFLDALEIPSLDDDARQVLDGCFTLDEIKTAIRSFPNGKACGPDGFGIEFYKTHIDTVAPLLLRMINCSLEESVFPQTIYDAHVCLLLKKDRDDADVASYRPLSLLNSDQKIIAKVLTNRLNKYIGTLIHPDQTGFIPDRFSFSNTRRLLNVMYSTKPLHSAVISLDAQQAFDQVEWRYMFAALEKFGFGDKFLKFLRMLYAYPKSSVLTNFDRSAQFMLGRGTRQGCCLSPMLFALALEPLAIAIRASSQIGGIGCGRSECTIGLYADDIILTLSDVKTSLPPLLDLIKQFGQFSGFTINWDKSLFMPLTGDLDPIFLKNLPLKLATDHFKYLGINITRNPKLLFKHNYMEFTVKLRSMIDKWKLLPLSLIGRINIIKMIVLPKFIYLFQNVPIFLTSSFFKTVDSLIMPFIWAYKPPRITKAHLQKHTTEGGLGLPVLRHYYWACNARTWVFWYHATTAGQECNLDPSWPLLESDKAVSLTGASLPAALFSESNLLTKLLKQSKIDFILSNSLRILKQIKGALGLSGLSCYAPLRQNPTFKPGLMDPTFASWAVKGLSAVRDFYINKSFASFAQLQVKFGIPAGHLFRYLQIRNFVRQSLPLDRLPDQHNFYSLMTSSPTSKGLISQFVSLFTLHISSLHIRDAWIREIGVEISDGLWEMALERIKSCSINARLQLIQYKIIHRLHYSKTKLNKIFPTVSPTCDKCKTSDGTLAHLFWDCSKLSGFWDDIFHLYSVIYNKPMKPDGILVILHCSTYALTLPKALQEALAFGLVVAKRVILREWKSSSTPCFKVWLNDMVSCLYLEELRYTMSDNYTKFFRVWGPFIDYIKRDKDTVPN